jgi:transportin-1
MWHRPFQVQSRFDRDQFLCLVMSFHPDHSVLSDIVALLGEAHGGRHHSDVLKRLEEFYQSHADEYPCYLAWILCMGVGEDLDGRISDVWTRSVQGNANGVVLRTSAGLMLKNHIKLLPQVCGVQAPGWLQVVVDMIVRVGLGIKEDKILRHTAATCCATLVGGWPGCGPYVVEGLLRNMVDLGDEKMEGALNAVQKLWEDFPFVILNAERDESGNEEMMKNAYVRLHLHIVSLLELAVGAHHQGQIVQQEQHQKVDTTAAVVTILNYALFNQSSCMDEPGVLDRYKLGMFALAHNQSPKIRRAVCVGLNHLAELAPSKLEGELPQLIEYMIQATEDAQNVEVALEASEFWTVFSEAGFDGNVLRPFVPRVIPLLLTNMKFDEYDEEVADAEEAEVGITSDETKELRPHHGKSGGSGAAAHIANEHEEDGEDEEEDGAVWNLRKSAAAGLDMISAFLGDEILPILLPEVQLRLQDNDWRSREAAILALGAVSNGCHSGLREHLDAILAAVLPSLIDPRPMLRVISCWTLTRYSRQVYSRAMEGDDRALVTTLNGIVDRLVNDRNKMVQISAAGSLSTLVEEEPQFLFSKSPKAEETAGKVCGALIYGLNNFGRRALRAVYDAISVLSITSPEVVSIQSLGLVAVLFRKLESFPDGDTEILPYLDCLSNVGASISPNDNSPMIESAFCRCSLLIERYFIALDSGALDEDDGARFIEHLLDAIDGLTQGLGPLAGPLFAKTSLGSCLVRSSCSHTSAIRQSAFGLLGDLMETPNNAVHVIPYLSPLVEAALESMKTEGITSDSMDACNNATWCLGIISKACSSQDVGQFALVTLERLLPILTAPMASFPRSLAQNASVCLGRLCLTTPDTLAPHASAFMGGWCAILRGLQDGEEKLDAYKGVLRVVQANPNLLQAYFKSLCECFASWRAPTEIDSDMKSLVDMGVQRGFDLNCIHPSVRQKLGI